MHGLLQLHQCRPRLVAGYHGFENIYMHRLVLTKQCVDNTLTAVQHTWSERAHRQIVSCVCGVQNLLHCCWGRSCCCCRAGASKVFATNRLCRDKRYRTAGGMGAVWGMSRGGRVGAGGDEGIRADTNLFLGCFDSHIIICIISFGLFPSIFFTFFEERTYE